MKKPANKRIVCFLTGLALVIIFAACDKKPNSEKYFPESSITAASASRGLKGVPAGNQAPSLFVQMGHTDDGYTANTVAIFTPDGRHILTGSKDGLIKLWKTETGREVRTFRCQGRVSHIAVSKNGRYLVSGDDRHRSEGNINVWEISSGHKIRSFSIDNLNGPPITFCNNDKSILAGGRDGLLRLWDIASGELIREYAASISGEVSALVIRPDGGKVVVAYRYNGESQGEQRDTIAVWDMATGEKLISFNSVSEETVALAVTPDGSRLLASDYGQNSVQAWDLESGTPAQAYITGGTSAIDISAGGRYALFGGYMNFSLVELTTGKEIRKINQGTGDWIKSICFSPDGRYALAGDQVPQPKLWDLNSGKMLRTLGGYAGKALTARTTQTGQILMTGHGYSNSLCLWDYKNGALLRRINNTPGCLSGAMAISPDGIRVAFAGWDTAVRNAFVSAWNADTAEKIVTMHPAEQSDLHATAPVFTSDGRRIIWALQPDIIISDAETGGEIKKINPGTMPVNRIMLDPTEQYLLAWHGWIPICLIDIDSGNILKTWDNYGPDQIVTLSSDGKKLYALTGSNKKRAAPLAIAEMDLTGLKVKTLFDFAFELMVQNAGGSNVPERLIAGPAGNNLFFFDSYKNQIYKADLRAADITAIFKGHTDAITDIDTTPDGKFLCSSSDDGTTRLWDAETGKEVAKFVGFSDGEWIVITPEGYFNASANGAKYLNVRVGDQVYSIDNFYEQYYNPAYVAAVLQGETVRPAADIRQGIAPPPEVKIVSPENSAAFKDDEIDIIVSAKDIGGGIDEIRLYHNGKVINEERRGVKIIAAEDKRNKHYTVTLVNGLNTFKAIGFSRDRTASNPSEITVTLFASEKSTSLYVLTVGINKYKNPALNLNYAEPDARGIADFFRQGGPDLFKAIEIKDIYNEKATKNGILSALNALGNTSKQDVVLIYLAGHGENINEKWYFIPYELTYPEREDEVTAKAVSSDELSEAIKNITAQKILVLIDACKSGALLLAFRGFEDRKALAQLSRATGVHVVAASSKDQFAAEVKDLGHGVFTYTLLEGLRGQAAPKGETITVRKLMGYIEEELPALTIKYRQEAQYPVVDSRGMDFPLAESR